ncbi:MAG: FtsX-like permease family protein [Verrucomicrobia bacterium]|nr:FtsX-like permease family protein [Verrucomicrobiota bacterium]
MKVVWIILERCALRHWRLAWRQQVALMLILALGSGVYLAMRLANRAALSGFESFTDGITRQPDWTITGATGPLPETTLREMRDALAERPVHLLPLVEETVTPVPKRNAEIGSLTTWRLIGMDWVALLNLRGGAPVEWQTGDADGVFISAKLGARLQLKPGDELPVVLHERVVELRIAGIIPEVPGVPAPPDHLLLMDLPAAQKIMQRTGNVDRVEVLVQRGPSFPDLREETGTLLREVAHERWLVSGAEDRRALAGTMTAAFRLNLTILSLLALFVGGYLIFQALDGVVLRRREEIGILKSLGVTDVDIQRAFLIEAMLLGLIGGSLGLLVGQVGAQAAVSGVSKTMNTLYGATSVQNADLSAAEAALSMGIALITSLIAAWWPAREAARTPPAQMLGRKAATFGGGGWWSTEWLGWALMFGAILLAQCGTLRLQGGARIPLASYAAALCWLLGVGLAAGSLLRRVASFKMNSATGRVALSHLRRPTVRHRFAVAALASAVAMTAGMAIMVASFDYTMRSWIERTMKADLYVASAGAQSASSTNLISAGTVEKLRALPEAAEVVVLQARPVTLRGAPTMVLGVNAGFAQRNDLYAWVQRPTGDAWWKSDGITPAIMNESFAERFEVAVGDTLDLPGGHRVRIAGIHSDYGNERGSISISQNVFREWFDTDMVWRVAMMLQPGTDAEALRDRLQSMNPGLTIYLNAHLRREAMRIFRQTFAVTHALEVIGVFVAVAGLGLALASLLLERRADLSTLRTLGMTPRQIAQSSAWEGAGVACAGTLMGILAGVWLGWLLIYRINKQCFGWTLGFALPWWQIAILALAVIGVGSLVAAIVGKWGAKMRWEEE